MSRKYSESFKREVVKWYVSRGCTYKELAEHFNISLSTAYRWSVELAVEISLELEEQPNLSSEVVDRELIEDRVIQNENSKSSINIRDEMVMLESCKFKKVEIVSMPVNTANNSDVNSGGFLVESEQVKDVLFSCSCYLPFLSWFVKTSKLNEDELQHNKRGGSSKILCVSGFSISNWPIELMSSKINKIRKEFLRC